MSPPVQHIEGSGITRALQVECVHIKLVQSPRDDCFVTQVDLVYVAQRGGRAHPALYAGVLDRAIISISDVGHEIVSKNTSKELKLCLPSQQLLVVVMVGDGRRWWRCV